MCIIIINIPISNENDTCDVFSKFVVRVDVDIENNIRFNGFEEKPWTFLNINFENTETIFIKPINLLVIEQRFKKN